MAKEKTKESIMITGVITSAFTHTEKNEDGSVKEVSNVIKLSPEVTTDKGDIWEVFTKLYEHSTDKWIPSWFKDKSEIRLKSVFNIYVQLKDESAPDYDEIAKNYEKCIMSFSQFVERGKISGAKVIIRCNIRESAIYPSAMQIIKDGEVYDPFADF